MIIASMATIPGREEICTKAFDSLRPQFQKVLVCDYQFLGRTDDARKFIDIDGGHYIFTVDDDLIYPPNYAETMIAAIEKYKRTAVVTLHGSCVSPPIESYYRGGRDPKYHCLGDVQGDHRVHIPGTGVMAYHTDTIRFSMDDFPEQNMADIQAGIKCNALSVPVVIIGHRADFLTYQETHDETIWDKYNQDDAVQTRLVNETEWVKW